MPVRMVVIDTGGFLTKQWHTFRLDCYKNKESHKEIMRLYNCKYVLDGSKLTVEFDSVNDRTAFLLTYT